MVEVNLDVDIRMERALFYCSLRPRGSIRERKLSSHLPSIEKPEKPKKSQPSSQPGEILADLVNPGESFTSLATVLPVWRKLHQPGEHLTSLANTSLAWRKL